MRLTQPNKRQYNKAPFKKGKITCPVCGNSHRFHCSLTVDGSLAICKNKWSDQQAKDGRYIHIINPSINTTSLAISTPHFKSEPQRTNAETCDAVYSALLSHLVLTPEHGDSLLNERGLSDTTIAHNLYSSVPDSIKGNRLARALARFFDLKGVPGFYYQVGSWQLNTSVKGFYVPYRDELGRVIGMQIRRNGNPEPKYLWLTSVDKPQGTSSGAPLHFARPDLAEHNGEFLVTEGALKADCISEFEDIATVALAGVSAMNPNKFASRISQAFPNLPKAIMAFDMDWKTKQEVKSALLRLQLSLRTAGFTVVVRLWDEALGKGLDDALIQAERVAA